MQVRFDESAGRGSKDKIGLHTAHDIHKNPGPSSSSRKSSKVSSIEFQRPILAYGYKDPLYRNPKSSVDKTKKTKRNKTRNKVHRVHKPSQRGKPASSFRPRRILNSNEQFVTRFKASRAYDDVDEQTRHRLHADDDAYAQVQQTLNSILLTEASDQYEYQTKLLDETTLTLNSIGKTDQYVEDVSSYEYDVIERAERIRLKAITANFINAAGQHQSSKPSRAVFPDHEKLGVVPDNVGIDSHCNINIIRVTDATYEQLFPFGCVKSTSNVSWAGGGSKRLPLIGTALVPMICEHRGDFLKVLIPIKDCYAVRCSDFNESLFSYELLRTQNSRHRAHLQSDAGGMTHYIKLLDVDSNMRKIHIRTLGNRWWLPCTTPETHTGREFTGSWCNSLVANSVSTSTWPTSLEEHMPDQDALYRRQGNEVNKGGEKWSVPDAPFTETIGSNYTKTDRAAARRIQGSYQPKRSSADDEPVENHNKMVNTQARPLFIIEEEEEDDSDDSGETKQPEAQRQRERLPTTTGDDEGGALPTYSTVPVARGTTNTVDEQVRKSIERVISDLAAGAAASAKPAKQYGNRSKPAAMPVYATFRPTRVEVHSLLCHVSGNVAEKSANHWSNTVVRGPRLDHCDCDTCNLCNDRRGRRRGVNLEDDANPNHCGKTIQFDLQSWNEPSMGGEKTVLRGIEGHFGLAFATYHLTKGTAEIIQGAESILDDFAKHGGGGEVNTIICDVEGALVCDEFQEICKSRRINLIPHTKKSPEDTGLVERLNQEINGMRKAILFDSKVHDSFRMIADRHCMKVRNAFIVSGSRPAPPLTCSTGRAMSPKFLHPFFSDIWGLDTNRLAKHGVIKDETTRTRGYYVGFDDWGILVFDPLSGNIIRCGRRQYIIKERFSPRDAMPLDVTVYEADPCNFQRPDTRANKGRTVSAWAQGKIPWTLLSPEERHRLELTMKRSKDQKSQFIASRDVNAKELRSRNDAVRAVSEMLQKRGKRLKSNELKAASKMVKDTISEEQTGTSSVKRERYPDDDESTGDETKSSEISETNNRPVRPKVPVDKSLIGKRVAVLFSVDGNWYEGIVKRSWANAVPETLYQVRYQDGDTEDYCIDEIQRFVKAYKNGQRATQIHKKTKRSKSSTSTKRKPPEEACADVKCDKLHTMTWGKANKNTWCDTCDENIDGMYSASCKIDGCDIDYCKQCLRNAEQKKRRQDRGSRADEFNMANAVHFEIDILNRSNEEEWRAMEDHIEYKNVFKKPTKRIFNNEKRFGVNTKNRKRTKRYLKRCTKFINAVIADPDSPTARECLNEGNEDYDLWLASTMKEVGGVMRQALKAIPLDELTREQRKRLMRSKLVMRVKRDQYGNIEKRKVRLVAMGNTSVKGVTHDWTHAPGASPVSMRALVALACKLRKVISSYDLEQCYLQAPINQPSAKDIFLYPPRELIFRDKMGRPMVFKCTSNLYGLASGGADSFAHVDKHMITEQGLVASRGDPCLYAYRAEGWTPHSLGAEHGQYLFHSLYTDDGIYFGSPEAEKSFEDKLNAGFNVRINSVCKFILGMRLEQLQWDDDTDTERIIPKNVENQKKLSQRAFGVEIIRITPERQYLHDSDKHDSDDTGAPTTPKGELPDYNAKTILQPGAPRMKTPLSSENSKILDESFAAAVKLLKEKDLLSESLVFLEVPSDSGGWDVEETKETDQESKADPMSRFRATTPEEEIELQQLMRDYPYRTLVAKINYLARMTRPDLSHSVGVLSRHLSSPGIQAYRALKSVCIYILNTLDRGLIFHESSSLTVPRFYVDANFPFGRARGGYVAMYLGASIDWQSKLAASAAASTAEAEIQAAFAGFCKALATKKDLDLLGILNPDDPVDFEEDSQAALLNLTGEVLNGGSMKWIANKFLKSIEWVKAKLIRVHKCDTKFMWADGFTKQLPLKQHNIFVQYTMGCET